MNFSRQLTTIWGLSMLLSFGVSQAEAHTRENVHGEYTIHAKEVFPDKKGPISQAWNGKELGVLVEGMFIPAPLVLRIAKFSRNTVFSGLT